MLNRTRPAIFVLSVIVVTTLGQPLTGQQRAARDANVQTLVSRLELGRYKSTIEALSRFGDRRQGTRRNRDAVDWIETQLKSYGCTGVERLTYQYSTPRPSSAASGAAGEPATAADAAESFKGSGPGGSTIFGRGRRPTVNRDLMAQPDAKIRALNQEEPVDGERQEVYCTKVGTVSPGEMYIVSGHMDGHGVNQASNDDASGTALVMELARVLSAPDVRTDRSIRFVLWNNEETGLNGAAAYVSQRASRQGIEDPPGSGRYPEPRWLGMIQHDMMLFDHGAPGADGRVSSTQRREADVNIEFQANSKMAQQSMALALVLKAANEAYATDYPAAVGPHMSNTDSGPFMDVAPAISVREAERGSEIGGGWDPHGHTPSDVFTTYDDADFRLGLNAAQTTLSAVAQLAGAKVSR
jgi:peptidase M28-like protein